MRALERLEASRCEIGPRGGAAIGKGLIESEMMHLDLSYNPLRSMGAVPILRGVPSTIRWLDLAFCGLDDESGVEIAALLERFDGLEFLGCASNRLGHVSGHAIANALGSATSLTDLRVGFQRLGTDASLALARALGGAAKLTAVYMENTCAAGAEAEVMDRVGKG